ncbi:MAG TPA: SUMF1/EgtB/PvdO family nonheme iron enzyme [Labilithrix sp.]
MNVARSILVALVFVLAACGRKDDTLPPIGQLLLYVDTDAPLPAAPGDRLGPSDPSPLFDRVRVEVYRAGENAPCDGCTHEFEVDRTVVGEGRASIGITTPPGVSGYRARVRLFRAAFVELGEPRPDATIESVVALPEAAEEGITPVTVVLMTATLAHPIGTLDAPAPATAGASRPLGTWAGAQRVPCANAPHDGEVCIPGGAYWMGNPRLGSVVVPGDAVVLRIASLAPFFLDAKEATVGAFRAAGVAAQSDPLPYSTDQRPRPPVHCTWTAAPGNDEELPVTCLSWQRARAFCRARGADLPSEAQFQYAASGLTGATYVWGDDDPTCDDAVYDRAQIYQPDTKCPGDGVGVAGTGARDRLVLPTGTVLDLAGNVSEHALDTWNFANEPCWGTGVFIDPVCTQPSANPGIMHASSVHSVVGGSFVATSFFVAAAVRMPDPFSPDVPSMGPEGGNADIGIGSTGFRCARADVP